jgi:hypothetical protein
VRALEGGQGCADHGGGREQVDGDDPVPGLAGHVGECTRHVESRRGDHAVDQPAGLGHGPPGGVLGGARVRQVALDPRHARRGRLPVDDERAAAGLGHRIDDRGAESARSAGHDHCIHGVHLRSTAARAAAMVRVVECPSR